MAPAQGRTSVTTPGNPDLTAAYADLVSGVLDARSDSATQAFDAEVAAAEADGRLDARTARTLRWWQRESLRSLVDHSRTALPPALAALGQAQAEAARGTAEAANSWARAVDDQVPPSRPASPAPSPDPPLDLLDRRRRLIVAGLNPLPREE